MKKSLLYHNVFIIFIMLFSSENALAQLGFCQGNSGDSIFTETFGVGTTNTPLPGGTTTYNYTNGFPNDGFYTVLNGTFGNGFDWHQIEDHTSGDVNGQCLIVNAGFSAGEFYRNTVSGLCENTTYEFSAWLINLVIAGSFCSTLPSGTIPINVRFEIWDTTDTNLLASGNTGNIFETSSPNWQEYALVFQTLPSQTSVILKMINNGVGGCGNDLAIDDIEFKTCGDTITVEDASNNNSVTICSADTPYSLDLNAIPDNTVFSSHFYQWQESADGTTWTDIVGETNQIVTVTGITATMYYRAKVAEFAANLSNLDCITYSEIYIITVNPATTPTFTQVADICSGDSLSPLPTTSNNGVTGTWNPALDNTVTTVYSFTPNSGQCAASQTMTIVVNQGTTPIFTQVADICSGDSLSPLPTTSNNGVTGTWNPVLNNTVTTVYTFTPDSGQCAASQSMTIIVNPITTPIFTQVADICSGDSFSPLPTTSNNGVTGTWNPVLNNTVTTVYTFTPDSGQCAASQSMTIVVNPGTTPTFTQVADICSGDSLSTLPTTSNNGVTGTWNPVLNNTVTSVYTFIPDSGQCAASQTMTIVVNPGTTPTFTQVADICSGDSLSTLPNTSNNGVTGTWNPMLDNTTTTIYTFTPSFGQCATSQTMTIVVNPNQAPTFNQVLPICIGETLFPLPTISNNGVTGTWSPAINNTATTTYTFIPDPGFCPSPVSLTIQVFDNPVFSLLDEYLLCLNSNGTIAIPITIDTGLNTSVYNFTWLLNGVIITGANQASYMPNEGGAYEIIVQNATTMCESNMLTTVTVLSEPEFEVEVVSDAFSENQTIQVTTINTGDFEYQLDNGVWQDEPIFNNVSIGEHQVKVRDKRGCIESGSIVIVMGYPKYFTPNGDGFNDTWNIVAPTNPVNYLASAKIYIFNRYGKLLKQLNPTSEGWNGVFNGATMPTDDYWFLVEYNEPNLNKRREFTGHFTLKR